MIKCELLLFSSFSTLCGKLPRVLTKVLAIIIYLQYLISTHFTKYRDSSKLNVILWLRVLGLVTWGTLRGRKLGESIALVQDVLPDTVRLGFTVFAPPPHLTLAKARLLSPIDVILPQLKLAPWL